MNFRRYYIANSIVFITQLVQDRQPIFSNDDHVVLLRSTLRRVKTIHPFQMLGFVFLPDHFHLLLRPTGDSNFSQIMHSLKRNFTKNYKQANDVSKGMKFWQKRFYDHVIRSESDFRRHLDYIHFNPVKHKLVARPEEWPHTSYLAWKNRGAYPEQWGWNTPQTVSEMHLE